MSYLRVDSDICIFFVLFVNDVISETRRRCTCVMMSLMLLGLVFCICVRSFMVYLRVSFVNALFRFFVCTFVNSVTFETGGCLTCD